MMNLSPNYKNYRAAVDRLYPDYRHLIAINDKATHDNADPVADDLKRQIDAAVLAVFPKDRMEKMLDFMDRRAVYGHLVGGDFANTLYSFYRPEPDERDNGDSGQDAHDAIVMRKKPVDFVYIAIDDSAINPRETFYKTSSCDVPAIRMKFNEAAMNPDMYKWYVFFHELCHGVIKLHAHQYPLFHTDNQTTYQYYKAMEESVCDAYAAIHIFGMYGDAALPFIKTYADMRLSRFYTRGHEYYTGPAMYDIIEQYRNGGLAGINDDMDALFKAALKAAEDNYVEREGFEQSYQTIDCLLSASPFTRFVLGREFEIRAMLKIAEHYAHKQPDERDLSDKQREMRDYHRLSMRILDTDYTEDTWRARWNAFKREIKMPFHKMGYGPHPGY